MPKVIDRQPRTAPVSVRFPVHLHQAIRDLAIRERRSLSSQVIKLVEESMGPEGSGGTDRSPRAAA